MRNWDPTFYSPPQVNFQATIYQFCKFSMSEWSENGNVLAPSVTFYALNEEENY